MQWGTRLSVLAEPRTGQNKNQSSEDCAANSSYEHNVEQEFSARLLYGAFSVNHLFIVSFRGRYRDRLQEQNWVLALRRFSIIQETGA